MLFVNYVRVGKNSWIVITEGSSLAQFFSQNFCRDSRQVCRPSAEIADKLVGYLDENFD
jgi:hypothetical protein